MKATSSKGHGNLGNHLGHRSRRDIIFSLLTFDLERYLGPEPQQEPRKFAFGFGRRICPALCGDTYTTERV